MVILDTGPELAKSEPLAIVHVALGRIVPEDTVHHDLLLPLVEPAVFAAEIAGGLCGRGRKVEVRYDPDQAGYHALKSEEPSPARQAIMATKSEDTIGQEGGDYGCGLVRDPKEGEAAGKFLGFVEVREIQDAVRNDLSRYVSTVISV